MNDGVKTEPNDSLRIHIDHNPLNQNSWHHHTPRNTGFDDVYQTPSGSGARSDYPLPESPQALTYHNNQSIAGGLDGQSGTPKLKGAVWPGMDIFDSATPDMRRMRNQKKHGSVLANMLLVSESIQQNEYIWDDKMAEITRTRNVYDSPSIDDCMVSGILNSTAQLILCDARH